MFGVEMRVSIIHYEHLINSNGEALGWAWDGV